ncbi:hypothetical protein SAMN02745121_01196 [Nannocystis exedens]|uniref:Caspase domain-containing protein n=1 Tax=Nannocystis exedens TaxID=54 RepID=A0A1I1UEX7_9BACT|nr:hypothetical protein NAEX_04730 [Nannocystis exedens]SFD69287.1 hypothetical protein SAMN02745121_01196 [Nannocystis exedens]
MRQQAGASDGAAHPSGGATPSVVANSRSPRPPLAVGPLHPELPANLPEPLRWLAIGGGATPEFNQVSIEQDLLLAQEVFGAGGALLFAGGPGSHGVQVEDAEPRGDPLLAALADLFAPRGGRAATYRPTQSSPIAAATRDNAIAAVKQAVAQPGSLLRLYLAGHGERGDPPNQGGLGLWGQTSLRVADLAEVLDAAARPVQVVATSCFSGAFADLVFARGEQAAGPAPTIRCGLFAATAEREASGCDPNPDRAAQEGYALHFLNALRGRDRGGEPLPATQLDLDGDGTISPLEAHARARIAGQGIDVPTTTSERWLYAAAPTRGKSRPPALPEEDAVIAALSAALGLTREGEVAAALEHVLADTSAAYERLDAASGRADEAYRATAAELLARFPVLDDPWHPDFAATLTRHRAEIEALLDTSAAYAGFRAAGEESAAAQAEVAELLARSARLERLLRALRVRILAGRLKGRGGPAWARYEALLACERGQI